MHGHAPSKATDHWLFNAEATSTLLIAAWYVVGIFATLGIIPDGSLRQWAAQWVIPCLLGVFYCGAGYLFQRYQHVVDFRSWRCYMKREAIVLLTPFAAFTVLTLLTTSLVALQPDLARSGLAAASPGFSAGSLVHAVFVHPVGPVGYFVVLLGFFVVARTPQTKRGMLALLACALAVKVIAIVLSDAGIAQHIYYYAMQMADNWVWFVVGIALRFFKAEGHLATRGCALAATAVFVGLAVVLFALDVQEAAALAVLTASGIACLYALSATRFLHGAQDRFFGFVTRYTMAIWLMHQILSELSFCGLFALGFGPAGLFSGAWVPVCAIVCLIACYGLPMLVMRLLSRAWKLGFIVYPSRYLPSARCASPSTATAAGR